MSEIETVTARELLAWQWSGFSGGYKRMSDHVLDSSMVRSFLVRVREALQTEREFSITFQTEHVAEFAFRALLATGGFLINVEHDAERWSLTVWKSSGN